MPKLSEIEIRSNDILIQDVPDDLIENLRLKAALAGSSFSEYVLGVIADHFEVPPQAFASVTVLVLDPE